MTQPQIRQTKDKMSKKTATIIISVVIILAIAGVLAFYFYYNNGQTGGTTPAGGTNIFPESNTGTTPVTKPAENATPAQSNTNKPTAPNADLLKELSTRPSAGSVAFATSSSQSVLVRFLEKGTGNVYEVSPDISGENRLSNTTLPKVQEAYWNKNGTKLIARYEKTDGTAGVETYYAELTPSTDGLGGGELKGSFLAGSIRALTPSPDQNKIFYLLNYSDGSSGVISDYDGTKKTGVFDSPLREWIPQWPTAQTISLTTRASAGEPGLMYLLSTKNGALSRAISGIRGLTTLVGPDGTSVLYSESIQGGMALKIYSLKTGNALDASPQTLPEKCVWSNKDSKVIYCSVPTYLETERYPDAWYQGVVSFSDDIWKIHAIDGTGQIVAQLKEMSGRNIDGTSLMLSPDENYLFFTDKNDSHIWSLRLLP